MKQYVQGVGGSPSGLLSVVIAVCALAGAVLALVRGDRRRLAPPFAVAAAAVLLAVLLAAAGKDYVVARNLIVAWVPLAVVAAAGWATSRAGLLAAAGFCAASLAIVIAVDNESRLQRPDWRGAAKVIGPAAAQPRRPPTRGRAGAGGTPPGPRTRVRRPGRDPARHDMECLP